MGPNFAPHRRARGRVKPQFIDTCLRHLSLIAISFAFCSLAASAALAQLAPIKPQTGLGQVPQGTGACSVETSCADLAPIMTRSALGPSPLEENLRYLVDSIGGRISGSMGADKASGWAVEALRHAGVDEVHAEKFTIPAGWTPAPAHVEILGETNLSVEAVSAGWSPPTPQGGITANIVDVGLGDAAGFAKAGSAVRGAIALVHTVIPSTWDGLRQERETGPAIVKRAENMGAAAILWMAARPDPVIERRSATVDGQIGLLPQAIIARGDAQRIAQLARSTTAVEAHFEMPNQVSGAVESANVVAEIRGRENPTQFVLLGAHLDSWGLGAGALDDGCNAALVIDAARVIHASGTIPRRSIRFVLFTGEEQGMLGSRAYAKAHSTALDGMVAAVIFDYGDGRLTGYSLGGRRDVLDSVRTALEPVQPLGIKEFTLDAPLFTDNFDFLLEGVPTLVANQDARNFIVSDHTASDTLDKVDVGELKRHVAAAAITAYALADAKTRIGQRQSHGQIDKLLRDTGLEREMKATGSWSGWEGGERGRTP
jgi:carboxypeptidase Q